MKKQKNVYFSIKTLEKLSNENEDFRLVMDLFISKMIGKMEIQQKSGEKNKIKYYFDPNDLEYLNNKLGLSKDSITFFINRLEEINKEEYIKQAHLMYSKILNPQFDKIISFLKYDLMFQSAEFNFYSIRLLFTCNKEIINFDLNTNFDKNKKPTYVYKFYKNNKLIQTISFSKLYGKMEIKYFQEGMKVFPKYNLKQTEIILLQISRMIELREEEIKYRY